jgi:cardiolipin synthase A/B
MGVTAIWQTLIGLDRLVLASGLALAHLALSLGVTLHALLSKRDIAATIGWIGLAWLSPFLGPALYWMFGINRVSQRARALGFAEAPPQPPEVAQDAGDGLAALARTGEALSGRPLLAGNALVMLHHGEEAYPRMLAAIEAAEHSIDLASYIFRDDAAGRPFIAALTAATRRGVAVRVLIDAVGGGYFGAPAYRALQRAGVPAARFMHAGLPWKMPFLNLRNHKKLLIVDGAVGFTGGLNIGGENLVRLAPRALVRDTHFELRGPAVRQLAEAFAEDWAFTTETPPLPQPGQPDPAAGPARVRAITAGPDQDLRKIETLLLQAATCARRSILVMTPYFLPDDRLLGGLALAALRGVAVDVLVPEHSNHAYIDWAMRAHIGPLLEAGARVWLAPPPFDHSKLLVVDGAWSLVGSSNWDMRSLRLNFELNLEVYDPATAAAIAALIEARRGQPLALEALAARTFPVRLRDAAARLALPYI